MEPVFVLVKGQTRPSVERRDWYRGRSEERAHCERGRPGNGCRVITRQRTALCASARHEHRSQYTEQSRRPSHGQANVERVGGEDNLARGLARIGSKRLG
jgi:hypothetical protein